MKNESGFTIGHIESFEEIGNWSLVRRSLGISSFGINYVAIPPGESIPEHNEEGGKGYPDQEELFIVTEGEPVIVIDGKEHGLKKGTYVRLDPTPKRYLKNDTKQPAAVLIISAPTTSGYKPPDWA